MIIFYDKDGKIIGTIEGRIHTDAHLKMWIGKKGETERLVVQWVPVKEHKNEKGETIAKDYAPDSKQPDVFFALDKEPSDIFKYKVNIKSKQLIIK